MSLRHLLIKVRGGPKGSTSLILILVWISPIQLGVSYSNYESRAGPHGPVSSVVPFPILARYLN